VQENKNKTAFSLTIKVFFHKIPRNCSATRPVSDDKWAKTIIHRQVEPFK
jgi:hypothetical protein